GSKKVTSELFRNWFLRNTASGAPVSERQKVLVVYGRSKPIRDGVFRLLEEVGLEPLDWHEMARHTHRGAPGMLEILAGGFKKAYVVVVLFTPDDEAKLRDKYV